MNVLVTHVDQPEYPISSYEYTMASGAGVSLATLDSGLISPRLGNDCSSTPIRRARKFPIGIGPRGMSEIDTDGGVVSVLFAIGAEASAVRNVVELIPTAWTYTRSRPNEMTPVAPGMGLPMTSMTRIWDALKGMLICRWALSV